MFSFWRILCFVLIFQCYDCFDYQTACQLKVISKPTHCYFVCTISLTFSSHYLMINPGSMLIIYYFSFELSRDLQHRLQYIGMYFIIRDVKYFFGLYSLQGHNDSGMTRHLFLRNHPSSMKRSYTNSGSSPELLSSRYVIYRREG